MSDAPGNPAAALLEIRGLSFAWPGDARPVLDGLDLELAAGRSLFLAGASGGGKSTLLALIGGLATPDAGSIHLAGRDLGAMGRAERDRFRADHVGIVFQQFNLMPWLDAVDNVLLGCRFSRARRHRAGNAREAAHALLEGMDLPPALHGRRADRLSVGQQQRVAAARALIGRPDLVVADEPTSALDADRRDRFLDLLFERVHEAGAALLFVSHDRSLAGRFDARRELGEGKVRP
ncbi:MAG: ABC transporter ATP-binding protein [Wenzhouxiangellaceae bacterium]|nr:ABC transporter ATP-binding protein [Wenzhouxiangellaceae bacterium]